MPRFYEVGLIEPENLLDRSPGDLPSLVLRRLQLGIALARGADTWLFDEPGFGMEAGARLAWFELIRSVARERGASVLAVSRSARSLRHLADRIGLLHENSLVETAEVEAWFRDSDAEKFRAWREAVSALTDTGRAEARLEPGEDSSSAS